MKIKYFSSFFSSANAGPSLLMKEERLQGHLGFLLPCTTCSPRAGWQELKPSCLQEETHTTQKDSHQGGGRKALDVPTLQQMKQKRTQIAECNINSYHCNLLSLAKRNPSSYYDGMWEKEAELTAGFKLPQFRYRQTTQLLFLAELEAVEGIRL